MTYNVHGCVGRDRRRNYTRIAEVISEASPDVVALQELDVGRLRSASIHQAQALATLLEMNFHFHPAHRVGAEEYGDAILSRLPISKIKVGTLPSGLFPAACEPRGALWTSIQEGETLWQVITTHFGLGPVERYRQALALMGEQWVGQMNPEQPLVVCGDLNSQPNSRVHRAFKNALVDVQQNFSKPYAPTFSTFAPCVCLDYIFVSQTVRVNSVEIIKNPHTRIASDHFPLLADLSFAEASART